MKLALAACLALSALLPIADLAQVSPAVAPSNVRIVNPVTSPAHVSDVNKPVHTPFSKRFDISFSSGAGNATMVVPAGKLLVITYVSADVGTTTGGTALFDLATIYGGNEVESHLPLFSNGVILGQQVYSSSDRTTVYADPGSTVTVAFLSSGSSGGAIVGIYGYLVDANAASFE